MSDKTWPAAQLIDRILDVIEHDIVPITDAGVARGNKLFGAAVIRKSDLSLVIAETNNEIENPLWHGEIHAIKRLYELPPSARPASAECIFIATHEPCSLCLSAITWAAFDNFYYLFSHEDSRDAFNIPHDLKILKEVFRLDPGGYNSSNFYWTGYAIKKLVAALDAGERDRLTARIHTIAEKYDALSQRYQRTKQANNIPLN
ncbi:MAG: nucleoside deaminase [Xanthobacteraceae bacterium]